MPVRILVVDDEEAILLAIETYLTTSPEFAVDIADEIPAALSLLEKEWYDAVVTDLRLSSHEKRGGLDVIRIAREKLPQSKIVLLTGYGSPDVEAGALALGADRCLQKPVLLSELENILRSLLALPVSSE